MSSFAPTVWVYTHALHMAAIAKALGGRVTFHEDGRYLLWKPEGHEIVIRAPFLPLVEPFDPEEYARQVWASWERCGARL